MPIYETGLSTDPWNCTGEHDLFLVFCFKVRSSQGFRLHLTLVFSGLIGSVKLSLGGNGRHRQERKQAWLVKLLNGGAIAELAFFWKTTPVFLLSASKHALPINLTVLQEKICLPISCNYTVTGALGPFVSEVPEPGKSFKMRSLQFLTSASSVSCSWCSNCETLVCSYKNVSSNLRCWIKLLFSWPDVPTHTWNQFATCFSCWHHWVNSCSHEKPNHGNCN